MSNNLKIPSPWSQLALCLCICGGMFVFSGVVLNSVFQSTGVAAEMKAGTVWMDPWARGVLKWGQALFSVTVFGIPALIYAQITFRDQPLQQLGLRPATRSSFYLLAILLLMLSLPLESWLGDLNKRIPLPHWMSQSETEIDQQVIAFMKVYRPFDPVINLVLMAALPGFFEELFFRGALQRTLIQAFRSPWAGIIVSAAIFSFFHGQFAGFIPRMFLGVLLGLAYWYSGSLWPSILAHFFFNGIQIAAAMFYPSTVAQNPVIPFYSVLLSLAIVVGLLYRMKKLSNGIEPFSI